MASFRDLRKRTRFMSERVAQETGVDRKVVQNVIVYAKSLTLASDPDSIDKLVFIAQLCTRFGMTSKILIEHIFESLRTKGKAHVMLEDYVKMICVFLTHDLSVKIEYVFRCYDMQRDGFLDYKEAHALLMKSIILTSEEHDNDDQVKDLIEIVMNMTDLNNDSVISIEEFSAQVHRDALCLELLGSVLPSESFIRQFSSMVCEKPAHIVSQSFANEREFCLQEPIFPHVKEKLYPVLLELP